jgi:sterol desaturase/sphingolipid hydroxylase (fatty acid hydroxylase superfamily)
MSGIAGLLHAGIDSYHRMDPKLHGVLSPIIVLVKFLPLIFLLERISGGKTTQYRSAQFRQDLFYWILRSSSGYNALLDGIVIVVLAPYLKVFNLHLLDRIAPHTHSFARVLVYLLIVDFTSYWHHRLQHGSRFLWAFHATHHSQRNLSFITVDRHHPFEDIFRSLLIYTPLLVLGGSVQELLPIALFLRIVVYLQHSQMRWQFGPLEKVLVTPHFHAIHHSADRAHRDKNFGLILGIWDACFGTAAKERAWPAVYGIDDLEMETLAGSLLHPFRMVYESYLKRREGVVQAGD